MMTTSEHDHCASQAFGDELPAPWRNWLEARGYSIQAVQDGLRADLERLDRRRELRAEIDRQTVTVPLDWRERIDCYEGESLDLIHDHPELIVDEGEELEFVEQVPIDVYRAAVDEHRLTFTAGFVHLPGPAMARGPRVVAVGRRSRSRERSHAPRRRSRVRTGATRAGPSDDEPPAGRCGPGHAAAGRGASDAVAGHVGYTSTPRWAATA